MTLTGALSPAPAAWRVIAAASPHMTFEQRIVNKDRAQGVFNQSFLKFSDRMIANPRMQNGQKKMQENAALFGKGTDVLDHDNELANLITKIFAERTGRFVPVHQIKTKLTDLRKRGLLPKVEQPPPDSEEGFGDIDKVSQ